MLPLAAFVVNLALAQGSGASPPACQRSDIDLFAIADLVATAELVSSRRWQEGSSTLHLVATYRLREVFKGDLEADATVIVTRTCLDMRISGEFVGRVDPRRYCPGGAGLSLVGVDADTGEPREVDGGRPTVVLFLRANKRRGAPELTWLEVPRIGFMICGKDAEELPVPEREAYRRLLRTLGSGGE